MVQRRCLVILALMCLPIRHESEFCFTKCSWLPWFRKNAVKTVAELCDFSSASCDLRRVTISILFHYFACKVASDRGKNDHRQSVTGCSEMFVNKLTLADF